METGSKESSEFDCIPQADCGQTHPYVTSSESMATDPNDMETDQIATSELNRQLFTFLPDVSGFGSSSMEKTFKLQMHKKRCGKKPRKKKVRKACKRRRPQRKKKQCKKPRKKSKSCKPKKKNLCKIKVKKCPNAGSRYRRCKPKRNLPKCNRRYTAVPKRTCGKVDSDTTLELASMMQINDSLDMCKCYDKLVYEEKCKDAEVQLLNLCKVEELPLEAVTPLENPDSTDQSQKSVNNNEEVAYEEECKDTNEQLLDECKKNGPLPVRDVECLESRRSTDQTKESVDNDENEINHSDDISAAAGAVVEDSK